MNWQKIESSNVLDLAFEDSFKKPVLLFKHSTRCSISSTALGRLQRNWRNKEGIEPYYLDLLSFRAISSQIEQKTGVEHASPQAILLVEGKVAYAESHFDIDFEEIVASAKKLTKIS